MDDFLEFINQSYWLLGVGKHYSEGDLWIIETKKKNSPKLNYGKKTLIHVDKERSKMDAKFNAREMQKNRVKKIMVENEINQIRKCLRLRYWVWDFLKVKESSCNVLASEDMTLVISLSLCCSSLAWMWRFRADKRPNWRWQSVQS